MKKENLIRYVIAVSKPLLAGLTSCLFSAALFANPVLENVSSGNVSIQQAPNSTVVNQTSDKAIINWNSFNIGATETTHFQQPAGGVALNRINPSQGVSQIYGRLTATGQIILVNPAGIFFGPGSYVNVGGLIASTANLTDKDFLNNYYHFANVAGYNGAVINQGTLIAANNGLVALIGGAVRNDGMIVANMSHAILAAGDAFTMTFAGNDLVSFSVDSGVTQQAVDQNGRPMKDGVTNTGRITANGGQILIAAKDAAGVLDHVISMQGIAEANSVSQKNGTIILAGDPNVGTVYVGATLTASSGTISVKGYDVTLDNGSKLDVSSITGNGGFIETSGTHNIIIKNIFINTAAPQGKAGTWLIDPADINITTVDANITGASPFTATAAGATLNVATLTAALATGNVTVQTTNDGFAGSGNITVSSAITWSSSNALLLQAFNNIIINAPISGMNGSLNLSAVNAASSITTGASGSIDVNNFNLLQGQWNQVGALPAFNVRNNFSINSGVMPNATTQFIRATSGDGTVGTPYVITDVYGLQGIGSNATTLAQYFNLGGNVDATSTLTWNTGAGFVPIGAGSAATAFQGFFNGQNFVINNLYINRSTTNFVGLFGTNIGNGTTISNLGLTNVNITGQQFVGGLVGLNSNGGVPQDGFVGGSGVNLGNTNSNISNVYTTGNVTAIAAGNSSIPLRSAMVGGLVGYNTAGTISDSYSEVNVYASDAAGSGALGIGGFMGQNYGNVLRSYATGNVTVANQASLVGGFVGFTFNGTISESYSSGNVYVRTGSSQVGGFAGYVDGGPGGTNTITNAYSISNIYTNGSSMLGGFVGILTDTNGVFPTISNSYSSGSIIGLNNVNVGGFVGTYAAGNTTNNFWDTQSSGIATDPRSGSGVTGQSTSQMMALSTFTGGGWSNTAGVSGSITNVASATVTAPNYTWFIFEGSTRPMLMMENNASVSNGHNLQMMGVALGGSYTLKNNIDLSGALTNVADVWGTNYNSPTGTGFVPVGAGTTATAFQGTFNGQNFVINHLYINRPSTNFVGLFGTNIGNGTTISNVGLTNVNITGASNVGGLVGQNSNGVLAGFVGGAGTLGNTNSNISNVYTTGSVTGATSLIGGLIGYSTFGSISNAYSTANVSGVSVIGGFIGDNYGNISNAYASGNVTATGNGLGIGGFAGAHVFGLIDQAYSSGTVTAASGSRDIGGFVGEVDGGAGYSNTISNAYSTSNVFTTGSTRVGGFAGDIQTDSNNGGTVIIQNSYSSGRVLASGNTFTGGFVGNIATALISTNNFWDTQSSGLATSVAGTGKTTAQMMTLATFTAGGWSNTAGVSGSITNAASSTSTAPNYTWFIFEGGTRPLLMMENKTSVINAHQLQMMGAALGADYSLANNIDLNSPLSNISEVWATNKNTLTGSGFYPLGTTIGNAAIVPFTGNLNGNNHIIDYLYINNTRDTNVGLIANYATGTISNIGLTNIAITSTITGSVNPIGGRITGGLVGNMPTGSVSNSFTSGNIIHSTDASATAAGGLIGFFGKASPTISASISNSYNSANVTVVGTAGNTAAILAGGLSSIFDADFTSGVNSISNSYNAGNITVSNVNSAEVLVGGLTGYNLRSAVSNVYNVGNVTVTGYNGVKDNFHVAGGIVGYINGATPAMTNMYNSGTVSGSVSGGNGYNLGAITGQNNSVISNSLFDSQTSGVAVAVASGNAALGTSSKTTAELMTLSTFSAAGWSITSTPSTTGFVPANNWFIFEGATRPILMMENTPNIVNGHNLQMMGAALGGHYQLINSIDMTAGLTNKSDVWATNYNTPTGSGFVPVGNDVNIVSTQFTPQGTEFTGTFNGNGYNINNLYINNPANISTFGLFGATAGNINIQNVGLTNVNIFGSNAIGGLIGNMIGGGTAIVSNVFVTGSVTSNVAPNTYYAIGGLIGTAGPSAGGQFTIQNTYSIATVSATANQTAGGLIGLAQAAFSSPGGTVDIINSYSTGSVTVGSGNATGFAFLRGGATVTNSFWDVVSSGRTNGYDTSVTPPTIFGLYAGCFAGGGTCATQASITNATNAGSNIVPKDLSVLATYTSGGPNWSITSTPSSTSNAPVNNWFVFEGQTRPMLMMENKSLVTSAHELQMMGAALGGSYTLANNIDMTSSFTNTADVWATNYNTSSGSGFVPVGSSTNFFTGAINGQNYTINQLYINRPTTNFVGLIGYQTAGTIQNLGLTNVNVTGQNDVGGMIGVSSGGTLSNLYVASGSVAGQQNPSPGNNPFGPDVIVGGLIGYFGNNLTLTNSYNGASVTGGSLVGGLVGDLHGILSNSFNLGTVAGPGGAAYCNCYGGLVGYLNSGSITTSYNAGAVIANGASFGVGGLLGGTLDIPGTIFNSYNTGSVSAAAGSNSVGGLVGYNTGSVTNSYSTGNVITTGSVNVGGLIGLGGSVTNSYWDTQTSGQATSAGGTGKTTIEMMTPSTFSTWDNSATWNIISGQTYPYLRAFYSTTPQAISGTTSAASNSVITLAVNGAVASTAYTGANGFFYELNGYNNISRMNNSLTNGAAIVAYQSGSTTVGNVVTTLPNNNGSVSGIYDVALNPVGNGLILTDNTVTAGNSGTTSAPLSNTLVSNARGVISDVAILFSAAGSNLTLNSGKSFVSTAATPYTIDGNIAATSAGITLNGPVIVGAVTPTISTTTSGDVVITNTVNLASNALTIDTAGFSSSISGIIFGAGSLTKSGSGTLLITVANSYSGGTTLNAGILSVGNNGALGTNTLILNAATLTENVSGIDLANNITLGGNGIVDNANGIFTLSGTINGANNLALNGAGTTILAGAVGSTTPLANVASNTNLGVNGGGIATTGNQTFANTVNLGNDAVFTSSGAATQSIVFNSNITGGKNLTLNGSGNGTYYFTLNALTANNVSITTAAGSTNNSLTLNSGSPQNFTLTALNTGNVTGIATVAGTFNFNHIHNLIGGNANTNTLTGFNGTNIWNINAINGGMVSYLDGTFANMQNLIGGTGTDTFNFTPGVSITGLVSGGDNVNLNTINFNAYSNRLTLTFNAPTGPAPDAGEVRDVNNALITKFNQILQSHGDNLGYIVLPAGRMKVAYYDSTHLNGEIADPFIFFGWIISNPPPTPAPTPIVGNNPGPFIAPINIQPVTNYYSNNNYSATFENYGLPNYFVINETSMMPLLETTKITTGATCYLSE
jgi:hypothetical protein